MKSKRSVAKKLVKKAKKEVNKAKTGLKVRKKFKKVMEEFSHGSLHSGSKTGPLVTNPKQAIAISYSEASKVHKKKKKK